jgi:hypothetical protein
MIELTHRDTVNEFLGLPDCADFWSETGVAELPYFVMFLYEAGCMMAIEPLPVKDACGIHIACLKGARGKNAVNFAKRCFNYIKKETGNRIFARIQSDRQEVITMATLSGMKEHNRSETHVFMEVM